MDPGFAGTGGGAAVAAGTYWVRGCAWKPWDDTDAARAGEFQARKTQAVIPPVRDLS